MGASSLLSPSSSFAQLLHTALMHSSRSSRMTRDTTFGEASSSSSSSSSTHPAVLHHNSQRRGSSSTATQSITPAASPDRRQRFQPGPPLPVEHRWSGSRGAPASINASRSQYRVERGHQFTVGNVSNGLIYLRYGLPDRYCTPSSDGPPSTASRCAFSDAALPN